MIDRRDLMSAAKVAGAYLLVAAAWIVFSDALVEEWLGPEAFREAQTAKGLVFVAVTSVLVYLLVAHQLSRRRRASRRVQEQAQRLRSLSRRLLEVQEEERRAVARELHDQVGQSLTLLHLTLQRARREGVSEEEVEEAARIVSEVVGQVRTLSLDLRPSLLDDLGLVAALRWLVERHDKAVDVDLRFEAGVEEGAIPERLRAPCFRIAQEALTNALKHSGAERVRIRIEEQAGELRLVAEDDGRGFEVDGAVDRAEAGSSFGLLGLRERAELAGGSCRIRSRPGEGTVVEARFPLGA